MIWNFIKNYVRTHPDAKFTLTWLGLLTLFFVLWLVFFDTFSLLDHSHINKEIDKLEENKAYYQAEIAKDLEQNNKLNHVEEVERYARENYFMKRDSEDIYIIEIDEQFK